LIIFHTLPVLCLTPSSLSVCLLSQATAGAGTFGTDYLLRAATALQGLGALTNNIATYYNNDQDSSGKPLTGANGTVYTITFPVAPPSNFFSSLTL
jgi:hypothetical protein